MNGYTATIRKYATDDSRVGLLDTPDGTGEVGLAGPHAGSRLAVRFTLTLANGSIQRLRYQVFGCGYTVAACAAAAELNEGRPLQDAGCSPDAIDRALGGLPAERGYCAELASRALQAALESARSHGRPVQADLDASRDAGAEQPLDPDDPVYAALMKTSRPSGIPDRERSLFAGVLAAASRESTDLAAMLGLEDHALKELLARYFPGINGASLQRQAPVQPRPAPDVNPEVHAILSSHVPEGSAPEAGQAAAWLARILAARAARPGHLWLSMGFFERAQLTAAIRRHLPSLAAANNRNMRWKRFLFKQACELSGGKMCPSPDCRDCSDHALCFDEED